jgi:hypothetical protein
MKLSHIFAALCFILSACGASKTSTSSPSRGNVPNTPGGSYKLGECNRVNVPAMNLTGQVGTYYDPLTRKYRSDFINLNIATIPQEIFTQSTQLIQIFRWSERVPGQRVTNQVPVRLFFVDKLNGTSTQNSTVDRLSKATLEQAKQTFGTTWSNVTLAQFFERAMVVITGVDLDYDAITLAFYNTSLSQNVISQGDVLLPPFILDPNLYLRTVKATSLQVLHPLYNMIGYNASESDYISSIDDICRSLSGVGTRVPASVEEATASASGEDAPFWQRVVSAVYQLLHDLKSLF